MPIAADHPLVEVKQLHVRFRNQQVLRDVTFEVQRGETLVIIGESGCGKTVLLKHLIGLLRPTAGKVLFDGQDLTSLNDAQLAEQRTRCGFVFQQAALFDSMTIGQNVAFPLKRHRRLGRQELEDTVVQRLAEVGLPPNVLLKKPVELSGGMRKRVGLARALMLDPELILYDEPTTGLDPIMSDVINRLILQTASRGKVSSVVVTHDMTSARKIADRIIMLYPTSGLTMQEPQIVFAGTPAELDACGELRIREFVQGDASRRLESLSVAS